MTRVLHRPPNDGETLALVRWIKSLPPAVTIEGKQYAGIELAQRALAEAVGKSDMARGAIKYASTVVERCIRSACWPGKFPEQERDDPAAIAREASARLKAFQAQRKLKESGATA